MLFQQLLHEIGISLSLSRRIIIGGVDIPLDGYVVENALVSGSFNNAPVVNTVNNAPADDNVNNAPSVDNPDNAPAVDKLNNAPDDVQWSCHCGIPFSLVVIEM